MTDFVPNKQPEISLAFSEQPPGELSIAFVEGWNAWRRSRTLDLPIAELGRLFPDALEWFDVLCPKFSGNSTLYFTVERCPEEPSGSRLRAYAIVPNPSYGKTLRTSTGREYKATGAWMHTCVRWHGAAKCWVRYSGSPSTHPRRSCPRTWPTRERVRDLDVDEHDTLVQSAPYRAVVRGVVAIPLTEPCALCPGDLLYRDPISMQIRKFIDYDRAAGRRPYGRVRDQLGDVVAVEPDPDSAPSAPWSRMTPDEILADIRDARAADGQPTIVYNPSALRYTDGI